MHTSPKPTDPAIFAGVLLHAIREDENRALTTSEATLLFAIALDPASPDNARMLAVAALRADDTWGKIDRAFSALAANGTFSGGGEDDE